MDGTTKTTFKCITYPTILWHRGLYVQYWNLNKIKTLLFFNCKCNYFKTKKYLKHVNNSIRTCISLWLISFLFPAVFCNFFQVYLA